MRTEYAKHLVTAVNCLVSLVVLAPALLWVSGIEAPLLVKWLVAALLITFVVFVTSRIAFRRGYESGRDEQAVNDLLGPREAAPTFQGTSLAF